MHKKEAIRECLRLCREYYKDDWILCWEKGKGFYPASPWTRWDTTVWPTHSDHEICDIHKSGRMIDPRKKSYIKQFKLYDHQKQKGQPQNFNGWVGENWMEDFCK